MFHAPSGAAWLGHVGFAYQISGTSNWVYGATEGEGQLFIDAGPPTNDESWSQVGTFDQVTSVFKNQLVIDGTTYHNAGYYTNYRCASTIEAYLVDAWNAVQAASTNGYDILVNNCLTKSIAILEAYYPDWSGNENPGDVQSPTFYYAFDLDGFGDVQWL
jgi:hypothetical protein